MAANLSSDCGGGARLWRVRGACDPLATKL